MADVLAKALATPHPEDRSMAPPGYAVFDDSYGSWVCKDPGGWYHGDGFAAPEEHDKAIAACWEHYDTVRGTGCTDLANALDRVLDAGNFIEAKDIADAALTAHEERDKTPADLEE
jgi:hypothetical protein